MLPEDQIRFQENRQWFNNFYRDIRQLVVEIHATLTSELGYRIAKRGWYYPKSVHVPSIPRYWLIACGEMGFALQIYLILDTDILSSHPLFTPDLSLIFVKHDRTDRILNDDHYGLRVINNSGISYNIVENKYIIGEITMNSPHTKYQAFQVSLNVFTAGNDIHQAILDKVVTPLKELPSW